MDIEDVLRLDSAFCNHKSRIEWLNLLKTFTPQITVQYDHIADKIADWLILKNVHPKELSLWCNNSSRFVISDDCVFKLIRDGSRLKKLVIDGDLKSFLNKIVFPYEGAYCTQLETLNICDIAIPDNGLEILSKTCHQLK